MSGHIDLSFEFGKPQPQPTAAECQQDTRRILVLSDFSFGCDAAKAKSMADRRPRAVDVDNLDEVLARLRPSITTALAEPSGEMTRIEFHSLDDFHPDRLYQNLPVFRALRDMRQRLLDPTTFREAAAALSVPAAPAPKADAPPPAAGGEDVVSLGLLPGDGSPARQAGDDFREWVNQLVAPYLVPAADPRQSAYVASIDSAISDVMRRLLHDPSFQAVESAWRGLAWLVRSLSSCDDLRVYILDVSQDELIADIKEAAGDVRASATFKLLVEAAESEFGEAPWSMLLGNFAFGPQPADLKLLAVMGAIASHAGGPFLAAATPEMIGCRRLADLGDPSTWHLDAETRDLWQAIRTSPFAAWVGLALPRILLRVPYGKETDPVDAFEFEEVVDPRDHGAFFWGNPAAACAVLAARGGFSGNLGELDDLPSYVYREDDEAKLMPSTEIAISVRAAEAILDQGIMPLISHKNAGTVMVPRFQLLTTACR